MYEDIYEIEQQLEGFYKELEDAKEFSIPEVHESIVIKNIRFLESELKTLKDTL